jgi:hexosaminidase
MKRETRWQRFGGAFLLAGLVFLGRPAVIPAQELKLVPEPKQVERREGAFRVGPSVRIVLGEAHSHEDRTAAEMLAEEIYAATGRRVSIATAGASELPSGVIYLARLADSSRLRAALESKGLRADEHFDAEGYLLDADSRHIWVAGATGQGLFYGVQTLRQLLRPSESKRGRKQLLCPAVNIKDWPVMRWRGVHDDISRGPVPTLAFMKEQIRTVAEYKLNLFALYIEHVFDYQSQPIVAPKDGALTAAEIKELVAYARRYYVTLVPEQQAFGHLHHLLKYELYGDLAETPHGHVLTPANEKTYELIRELYAELVPLFPGPFLHIGADETHELGTGQTKSRVDQVGLGRVYLEHLRRVAELLKPYHKRLLFWGDIAVHYPELLGILSREMIAVPWAYDPRPSFDELIEPFPKAGLEFLVAPGASNWNRIFPDLDAALVNIRNFTRDGQRFGALGILNTTWADDGEALFQMTWPAVVFGAACSWQAGEASIEAFEAKYDWAFYRNEDGTFREALANLARAHALLAARGLGGALDEAFWLDPFTEAGASYTAKALPAAHELRLTAEHALASLYQNRAKARAHPGTLAALIFAAQRLDALGMKIQFADECSRFYRDAYQNQADRARMGSDLWEITGINGRLEDLRDAATRLKAAYAELWGKENRPYWLGNVLVRYDLQASQFQSKIESLRAAQLLYRERGALPPPESFGFFPNPQP